MKTAIAIIALGLGLSMLSASPIQKEIGSITQMKNRGVVIIAQKGEKDISFKVTWKPKAIDMDKNSPPRLDLFLGDDGEDRAKLQIRYSMSDKGVCHADFTLRADQLAQVKLVFRASQQFGYMLGLSDYMDGFKRFKVIDPFSK